MIVLKSGGKWNPGQLTHTSSSQAYEEDEIKPWSPDSRPSALFLYTRSSAIQWEGMQDHDLLASTQQALAKCRPSADSMLACEVRGSTRDRQQALSLRSPQLEGDRQAKGSLDEVIGVTASGAVGEGCCGLRL